MIGILSRYFSERLQPFGRLSKPPTLKSHKHLNWVRARKCVATGRPAEDAHHVLKKSQGTNDYASIPLTHEVHIKGHSEGWGAIETEYGIDIKDALIATLIERLAELEGNPACTNT